MDYKPGKPRLRLPARSSVIGGGLLERARSTTFALLGVTAAVGLAMVALALNQSWPLLADSPIPDAPGGGEAVGKARVAPAGAGRTERDAAAEDRVDGSGSGRSSAESPGGSGGPSGGSAPSGSGGSVYAAVPVKSAGRGNSQKPAQAAPGRPSETATPQTQTATPQPSPAPQPASSGAPAPGQAETPSPPATVSTAPPEEESNVPAWSQGGGHAYGRSDRDRDHGPPHGHRWDD